MSAFDSFATAIGGAPGGLLRDGYAQLPGILPEPLVARILEEADAWFENDRARRQAGDVSVEWFDSAQGGLTRWDGARARHVCLRAFEHAPSVLDVLEIVLETPEILETMRLFLGDAFVTNDCMLRRHLHDAESVSSLELHRDTPFEFGVGVFLEPISQGQGATAVAPGSQFLPIHDKRLLTDHNLPLGEGGCIELLGRPGDCYLFLGEAYHGVVTTSTSCASRLLLFGFHPGPSYLPPDPLDRMKPPAASALQGRNPRLRAVFRREAHEHEAPGALYQFVVDARRLAASSERFLRPLCPDDSRPLELQS